MARPIKETPILFDEVCAIRKPFLLDYKMRCVENAKFGCRFLTVDAYIEKIPFYKKMTSVRWLSQTKTIRIHVY